MTGSHGVVQDSLELLEPSNPPASAFRIAKTLSPCYCAEPPLPLMSFLIVPVHDTLATCIILPLWMSSSVILLGVSVSQERIESRRWKQLLSIFWMAFSWTPWKGLPSNSSRFQDFVHFNLYYGAHPLPPTSLYFGKVKSIISVEEITFYCNVEGRLVANHKWFPL